VEVEVGSETVDIDLMRCPAVGHSLGSPFRSLPSPATHPRPSVSKKMQLDDFAVLSVLGQGGYGKVYLVENCETGEVFAMKCMKKSDLIKKNVISYAHDERSVLIAASHPFIVHLRFAFQTQSKLYLILEYIPGGELFGRLNAENFFLEPMAVFYAAEIVSAISHLHSANIIYRDLKPENLLIQADGHICLTDFGLAKPLNVEGTRTFCGTLAYLAPEVVSKKAPYGKPADWWSLGVLLFEMLCGRIPFDSANRNTLQKKIMNQKVTFPSHITITARSILKKLLCRDPKFRLGSKGDHEVRNHAFFRAINWDHLENKMVQPPFLPDLSGPRDTHYFDAEFTDLALHSPVDTNDVSMPPSYERHFVGFSFTR